MEGVSEEVRNPFSEAQIQDRMEAAEKNAEIGTDRAAKESQPAESSSALPSKQAAQEALHASGKAAAQAERVLVLGDFDGSGTLSFVEARRLSDGVFQFPDATRTFNLYMNSAAVEAQRSFTVEDVNGDGFADLMVTGRSSLFGGVLHGDGKGDYRVANTFLTGYEPAIAALGPVREGGREIITVSPRSGATAVFRPHPRYLLYRSSLLDFAPEYASRMVDIETGLNYLLAARTGSTPRIYGMLPDSRLELAGDFPQLESGSGGGAPLQVRNDRGSIMVYQVGARASVVMQNREGQAFNVANLKVSPEIFLIVGDLYREGTLDVAVAHLMATAAK